MGISRYIGFTIISVGLVSLFGISNVPSVLTSLQNTFNIIGQPWPVGPQLAKCQITDVGCNLSNVPAWSAGNVLWIASLISSFFIRTTAFNGITQTIVFGPWISGFGIPFAPIFFFSIAVIIGLEMIRIFRGSASGT